MDNKFFLHQIKKTDNAFSKGIVVHDTLNAAKQGYHAYMGAYAYEHDANTDYVSCMITDITGTIIVPSNGRADVWIKPEPEPENETEGE